MNTDARSASALAAVPPPSVLGRKPLSLGIGLYSIAQGWSQYLVAREHFMDAMVLIVPDTLTTLVTGDGEALAMEVYGSDTFPHHEVYVDGAGTPMIRNHYPDSPLRDFTRAWAQSWNIGEVWVELLAAETLAATALCKVIGERPVPQFVTVPATALQAIAEASPTVRQPTSPTSIGAIGRLTNAGDPLPLWEPVYETRAEARASVMEGFGRILDDLLDEIEGIHRDHGSGPTPVKRHPEHFDWLVHYQVLGHSQGWIRDHLAPSVSRQAIAKAIRETAEQIGLDIRPPGQAGAPRRAKESATLHLGTQS